MVGRSAGWHFSSHLPAFFYIWEAGRQVGRWALFIYQPYFTYGRQVGRLALLFLSVYVLLDLVGRSASRYFSFARLLPHRVGRSASWHFSSHLPAFFYIWEAGRQVGRWALFICQPSSTSGRQVGRLALLFLSDYVLFLPVKFGN